MTLKNVDRNLFLIAGLVAGLAALWFFVLAPKQDQVKKLDAQVSKLQGDVNQQRLAVQQGRQARKNFPRDYHRLVVLGKAVPAEDETASLLVQLNRISAGAGVDFLSISGGGDSGSTGTGAVAAPAESAVATAPDGSSVGSAGFTAQSYTLDFKGSFFEIADFMAGLDRLVDPRGKRISADGRLITLDAFSLTPDGGELAASLTVNAYLTPAGQGLTAGATAGGPAVTGTVPTDGAGTTTTSATTTSAPTSP